MPIHQIADIISSRLNFTNLGNISPTQIAVAVEALLKDMHLHSNIPINTNSLITSIPMPSHAADEAAEVHLPGLAHIRSSDVNCTNQQPRHKFISTRANTSTPLPQERSLSLR